MFRNLSFSTTEVNMSLCFILPFQYCLRENYNMLHHSVIIFNTFTLLLSLSITFNLLSKHYTIWLNSYSYCISGCSKIQYSDYSQWVRNKETKDGNSKEEEKERRGHMSSLWLSFPNSLSSFFVRQVEKMTSPSISGLTDDVWGNAMACNIKEKLM